MMENRQLKDTIVALRGRIEVLQYDRDEAVQRATAAELRIQMERRAFAFEDRLAGERSASRDEAKHLQRTIATLREALVEKSTTAQG
ncbi:MAG: hypothetical protein HY748_16045 [Elusimicrobia bacterium]|nr:hypothetical protein [Elusimicrobiota bacterium]